VDLFSVTEPAGPESPLVVEVPHAGTWVPPAYLASLVAPVRALGRDADLFVDELYANAPHEGATLLVARTSRYVLDLNRSEDDWDDAAVETRIGSAPPRTPGSMPRGLVWRLTTDGEPAMTRPLRRSELDERIRAIHRPYHETLRALLERKRAKFGFAVLLAAHSMPSSGRASAGGRADDRADVVPGTQGRTTASAALIDLVERLAVARGLSVRHDEPYRGGFATRHYGRPREGIHAVQVELARRLYMNEVTLEPTSRFGATETFCRSLVEALGRARP
jgi:N-formylglutamate amidohydrolase